MVNRQEVPGPGYYQTMLCGTLPTEPHWTIGRKSRLSRRDRAAVPNRPKDLLVVDQVIVDLEVLPNPAAAREYAATHSALRLIVREIFEIIYAQKPEDPIELLRGIFGRERAMGGGTNEFAD
jgi:hypothetical protein